MPTPEIAEFGHQVSSVLVEILRDDLVGVYFVGSVALGGYVPAESDVDIVAVSAFALSEWQKRSVASAIVEVSEVCPARGVEFTLYRRDVAGSRPGGADFEVNANGGPRMPTAVHLDAAAEQGFWYTLDRACRAWRFAEADVLGSKLEGATWARDRWPDTDVIDGAVALRHGQRAALDQSAVDALLAAAASHLREAAQE